MQSSYSLSGATDTISVSSTVPCSLSLFDDTPITASVCSSSKSEISVGNAQSIINLQSHLTVSNGMSMPITPVELSAGSGGISKAGMHYVSMTTHTSISIAIPDGSVVMLLLSNPSKSTLCLPNCQPFCPPDKSVVLLSSLHGSIFSLLSSLR